jgi:hypothetical protein
VPRERAAPHAAVAASPTVALYVHGHQDDWQLFMGDRATASLRGDAKVVFVYTTAGDAGRGARYWLSRESGALASVDTIIGAGAWTCERRTVSAHPIQRCAKGRAVNYFMRIPNGNPRDGTGYGFGSLKLLRDLGTATVTVDTTTTYASWADLVATVGGILDLEAGSPTAPAIAVHAPDYDRAINPGDHNDHWATAEAVRAAVGRRPWDLTWYVDYRTRDLPVNLAAAAHADKTKEFLAYDRAMVAAGFGSIASQPSYQAWLWRRYDHTESGGATSPVGFYEAEAGRLVGAQVATHVAGFTGAGFADYINASGDYVEWRVYAPSAGSYALTFRYGLGGASGRPLTIRVNGQVVAGLGFPPTGSWSTWKTVSLAATLRAGVNAVRATAIGWSGANMDRLSVRPRIP